MEYFSNYEFGKRGSPPVSVEVTEIDRFPVTPETKIRSSANCDLEITLTARSTSSTDSATLEIYENDILVDSYKIFHTPKFLWEIDDANEYKYKVNPLSNVSHPKFDLKVGLKYGTKTVYPQIRGEYTTPAKTYTCPEPTYGHCEVELSITKVAGNATGYTVAFIPDDFSLPFPIIPNPIIPGTFGSNAVTTNIDDSKTYNIFVKPDQGVPTNVSPLRSPPLICVSGSLLFWTLPIQMKSRGSSVASIILIARDFESNEKKTPFSERGFSSFSSIF